MNGVSPYRRLFWLGGFLTVILALLGGRLYYLQVMRHEEFRMLAERNTSRMIERDPIRGRILDVRGNPLAISTPTKMICADPSLMTDHYEDVARVLARILGGDNPDLVRSNEAAYVKRLIPKLRSDTLRTLSLLTSVPDDVLSNYVIVDDFRTNSYVVIERRQPLEVWPQIEEAMTGLTNRLIQAETHKLTQRERLAYRALRKSVFCEGDQVRSYPNKALACHVVGYVNTDEDQTGASGIEKVFNSKLSGVRGWRHTEAGTDNREILAFRDQDVEPSDGLNVVLTLDMGLQYIVETELAEGMKKNSPISISCIMVRPRTGEILAMATLPNFDPNRPKDYAKTEAAMAVMRNRVISDVAEPGSTFKIVVVSGGLNEHEVTLSDVFDCEHGRFAFAGRVLHDHDGGYGMLTVEGIITKSSNIGAAKIGIRLGEERLYSYIRQFGFGTRTGIPLPAEVSGIVYPTKDWSKVSIAQIPMGQGVAVTPLQTVMAMSAIANHGMLMKPMLVDRLVDEEGRVVAKYQPQTVRQVISPEAARDMVTALKTVPTENGTAERAKMEHYTVAGKTGTAQKVEDGKYVQKFFASFIGFFPADNPELCISVVMDQPSQGGHFGGRIAGPVFKAIAERAANYLNIKPDIAPELERDNGPQGRTHSTVVAVAGNVPHAARREVQD